MDIVLCPDVHFASYKDLIYFIRDKFNLTLKIYNGYPQELFTGIKDNIKNYLNYSHITFGEVEIVN